MIFVDAPALIALMTGEAEADFLAQILDSNGERLCSALSIWETIAGLCRSYQYTTDAARADVEDYLKLERFQFVPIGMPEYEIAAAAYARFGKGRHPAGLNMGDCFAYACAKTNQAKLLYKGDDFAKTDLA
ncbi:MAG: type II toxin-antitoxin system VapC family toxin [Beijerinckiaceae bacterium]|nr:type II toxin-antitoxin system VapC family toxin [Beijerinckiaceae bacterium]